MATTERLRRALEEYYAAQHSANTAALDSAEFKAAVKLMRSLRSELFAAGIDPMTSWREPTRRALGWPSKQH